MKKKIIIAAAAVVLLMLFVPVPRTYSGPEKDEGTKYYQALTYKIVKWNRYFYNDLKFESTETYRFPHNFKSIDELWNGMEIDPAFENMSELYESEGVENGISVMTATVLEVREKSVLVEPVEGSPELGSSDKIEIPKAFIGDNKDKEFPDIAVGNIITISYSGGIAETYPAQIDFVYDVKIDETGFSAVPEKKPGGNVSFSPLNGLNEKITLSADDSEAVLDIINSQKKWEFSFDNISDIQIDYDGGRCFYDMDGGIITVSDEKAVVLNGRDKEKLNSIVTAYLGDAAKNEVIEETPAVPAESGYSYNKNDKIHYVRSNRYSETKTAFPYLVVIRSKDELKKYYKDNETVWYFDSAPGGDNYVSFDEAIKKYDDEFFRENALIFVVTEEGSGSYFYDDVNIGDNSITVTRVKPEVFTCDMAYWHIIIEVKNDDPVLAGKCRIHIVDK